MDQLKTKVITFNGGLLENIPQIEQGANIPGSAIRMINFEPYQGSGYRRINGYNLYDSEAVPGDGPLLGTFIFEGNVIACRGEDVYSGGGSGWTKINGSDTRPGALRYSATKYNWVSPSIVLVDGVNPPAKWDGTTWTELSFSDIKGAVDVAEFKNHMFFAVGSIVYFSAPNDETDYTTVNGAGAFNVGYRVEALYPWRDALYIFARDKIFKIVGNVFGAGGDSRLEAVTRNIGCLSRFSIQEIGGDIFFLAPDGIRTIAGTAKIGDVALEAYTRPIFKTTNTFINAYAPDEISSLAIRKKSQYRLFGAVPSSPASSTKGLVGVLKYGEEGLRVEWGQLQGIKLVCADSDYSSDNEIIVHGSIDGFVYRHDVGNTFNGTPIPFTLKTPYLPFDDPEIRKVLHKVTLYIDGDGAYEYTFRYDFDYDNPDVIQPQALTFADTASQITYYNSGSTYGSAQYATGFFRQNKFNIIGSCFSASFEIAGNSESAPFIVKSMNVQYGIGDRR